MPALAKFLAIAAVTVGMHATAWAATLYTPPLEGGNSCQVVNVGKKSVVVEVQILNYDGTVAFGSMASIGPGQVYGVGATPTQQAYCKIALTGGSKKAVRGSFCAYSSANHRCEAVLTAD